MRWNIDDVPVFVAVAEAKGVTAAARLLNMPKSNVSKALSRLESGLGVRLFDRNSRNVTITQDGEVFYRHCQMIMDQVNEAATVMGGLAGEPHGRLVVALPMAFGREIVAHHLHAFRARYPRIELEILITSHAVDIIRDRIDLAVVVGELNDSDLIAKPLYKGDLVWVAAPDYARTADLSGTAEALMEHMEICERRYFGTRLPLRENGRRKSVKLDKTLIAVNDPIVVREAVANGCGVSFIPRQYGKEALEAGRLVEVSQHIDIELSASELSAVYPSRRLMSNKTRVFLDFLTEVCRDI